MDFSLSLSVEIYRWLTTARKVRDKLQEKVAPAKDSALSTAEKMRTTLPGKLSSAKARPLFLLFLFSLEERLYKSPVQRHGFLFAPVQSCFRNFNTSTLGNFKFAIIRLITHIITYRIILTFQVFNI